MRRFVNERSKLTQHLQVKLTGFDRHRPQLEKMLKSIKAGDTLVVTSLDRLARSTHDLFGITKKVEIAEATLQIH